MTDPKLTLAAQAVLDAFLNCSLNSRQWHDGMGPQLKIAAAIRALADQVAPSDAVEPRNSLPMAIECQRIRSEILAIATELEGQ